MLDRKPQFGIAYLDMDGTGFTSSAPWILPEEHGSASAFARKAMLERRGFREVTVFQLPDHTEALQMTISWQYIRCHAVPTRPDRRTGI